MPLSLVDRFFAKVRKHKNGCWYWVGCKDKDGYGFIRTRREDGKHMQKKAHRISWELAFGPITSEQWVLHSCDNPSCVNPQHLFLGDAKTNAADMIAKGRKAPTHGKRNPASKLTEQRVRAIRAAYRRGTSASYLAKAYNVGVHTVRLVVRNKIWRHV